MSLSFSNATGNLFNRLGQIYLAMQNAQSFQGGTLTGAFTGINAQFTTREDMIPTFETTLTNARQSPQSYVASLNVIAQNVLVTMVQEDSPQPQATLAFAIPELIYQMNAAAATVKNNTATVSAAAATTNTGTGICIVSATDEFGIALENMIAEAFPVTCVSDALPGGGSTAGQEQFTALGTPSVTALAYNWAQGSGGRASLTTISSDVSASPQNVLTNSGFESWTGSGTTSALTNWTAGVGSFTTTMLQDSSNAFTGTYAVNFSGNGSQLTSMYQTLRDVPNSIPGIILPQTKYLLSFWTKVSSVPAAGVAKISLKDTLSGSVIGGGAVTLTLSAATLSYAQHYAVINTPLNLPTTLNLVVELSTALSSGSKLFIDELTLAQMTQFGGGGGPYLAVTRGGTNFLRGDNMTVTVANNYGGKFQTWFNRSFNMANLGVILPSSASPTISDALIG